MARGSRENENKKCVPIDSSISLVRMRRTSIISVGADATVEGVEDCRGKKVVREKITRKL